MRVIRLTKKIFEKVIKQAYLILKKGEVIVYPTETSYGLGGDATQKKAVKKIFKIKKRVLNKPVTFLVSSFKMAKCYFKFDKISWRLAKKYWPGPLTLVLGKNQKKKKKVYADPLGENKTFGVRISSQPVARRLVKVLRRPLVTTSANISGDQPAYSVSDVIKQFKNKKYQPDLILDFGKLKKIKTSTVIKIENNSIKVLRPGPIKIKN